MIINPGNNYSEIFKVRGDLYHRAMKKYPKARKTEIDNLFKNGFKAYENVLDVPSLGGYLNHYDSDFIKITYADFSPTSGVINLESPYDDWKIGSFDRIVSLAATHHIDDIDKFIDNIDKHLNYNGFVSIADVEPDSGESKFLDGYVDKYTITGSHKGCYHNFSKINTPWNIFSSKVEKCKWKFNNTDELFDFCSLLFGLVNHSKESLIKDLDDKVGIFTENEKIILDWKLSYNHYIKN